MCAMRRTIVVGIGGATCSGKTILAKHLARVLGGRVLHQDDFAPAAADVPYSKAHPELQDWDDPPGAVHWSEFREALARARAGEDATHVSRESDDPGTAQGAGAGAGVIEVDEAVLRRWRARFRPDSNKVEAEQLGDVDWVVVDGFLLYWDETIARDIDVLVLLRVPKPTLQARREGRVYDLGNGETWQDPPEYFDKIVWPAYLLAHAPSVLQQWNVQEVHVQDGAAGITRAFEDVCEVILTYARARQQ